MAAPIGLEAGMERGHEIPFWRRCEVRVMRGEAGAGCRRGMDRTAAGKFRQDDDRTRDDDVRRTKRELYIVYNRYRIDIEKLHTF